MTIMGRGDNKTRVEKLHKLADVQAVLQCGRTSVYGLGRAGHLEFVKIGRSTRVTDRSLQALLKHLVDKSPRQKWNELMSKKRRTT